MNYRHAFLLSFFLGACEGKIDFDGTDPTGMLHNNGTAKVENNKVIVPEENCRELIPPKIDSRRLTPAEVESSLRDAFGATIIVYQFNGLSAGLSLSGYSTEPAANATSREGILSIYELAESVALQVRNDFDSYFSCENLSACVDALADNQGRVLFRGSWTAEEKESYSTLADTLNAKGLVTEDIIALLIERTIMSPRFLFAVNSQEHGDENNVAQLSDLELATRLALVLTGRGPDEILLSAAENGQLDDSELRGQIDRLLTNGNGFERFLAEWLDLKSADEFEADEEVYVFGESERQALVDNGNAFFREQLETGTYKTLMNGENAAFGPYSKRQGLLNHPYFLASQAHAFEGSEILRGSRILSRVMCFRFGSAPLNALNVEQELIAENPTKKDRSAARNALAACGFCHKLIDPVGIALESYDAIGQRQEPGYDLSGSIQIGETPLAFKNAQELASEIAESKEYEDCFTRQIFRFTSSRMETADDACALSFIRSELSSHTLKEALTNILSSPMFRSQTRLGASP